MNLSIRPVYLLLLTLLVPSGLMATDGYFSNGYGTPCKAMAGACVALPQTAMNVATNPAALFASGTRYDLGLNFFRPVRDFTVTGNPSMMPGTFGLAPGTVKSGSELFLVPSFAANWAKWENASFGISMYGNGGMNTNYDHPVFGNKPTGVNLMQMFIAPTYSVRLAQRHSLGFTAIMGYQRFKAEGLQAFSMFSSKPQQLTNTGTASSMGVGGRFGYLGQFSKYFSAGASYQTKIKMGKFDRYAGLFAEDGGFDVPQSWRAGVAVRPSDRVALTADFERIDYAGVRSIGNPMLPNLMQAALGQANGAGFGWKEVSIGRFGVQIAATRDWTVRAGYSTNEQPIDAQNVMFNILAPGVVGQHMTFGFTRNLESGKALHMAVVRAFSNTVTGPNPLDPPARQQIGLRMDQWEVEVGFTFGAKR